MDKLDGLVTGQLAERLFEPERLAAILNSLAARRAERTESVNSRIGIATGGGRGGRQAQAALSAGRGRRDGPR